MATYQRHSHNKATYLIINGRPGSGKSTLVRSIARRYGNKNSVPMLNDYPILFDMFAKEERGRGVGKRQFCRKEQGSAIGFDILDRQVLHVALGLLNEYACRYLLEPTLVLIEFARSNYMDVWNYLSPDIRKNAHCLFLQTPLETCIQRIQERVEKPRYAGDRLVSRETMRKNHQDDGLPSLQAACKPGQISVINNEGDWADTWVETTNHLDEIFYRAG